MRDHSPQLELWFFRDLSSAQRLALLGLCGFPVHEIGENHRHQQIALRSLLADGRGEGAETHICLRLALDGDGANDCPACAKLRSPEPPTAAPRTDGSDWLDYAATPAEHEQRRKHFAAQATTDTGREDAVAHATRLLEWLRDDFIYDEDDAADIDTAISNLRRLTPAGGEEGRDAIRLAGAMLSNCAYNLAQCDRLNERERRSLDEARKAWDAAIAAQAATSPEPQS